MLNSADMEMVPDSNASISANKQGERKEKRACRFFMSSRGCRQGDNCEYSHIRQVCAFYNTEQGCIRREECPFIHSDGPLRNDLLKECPNPGCVNLCIGKQCMKCHNSMNNNHGPPRKQTYSRPRRPSDLCSRCEREIN